jgi:glutamate synthase domain-containing protein 2
MRMLFVLLSSAVLVAILAASFFHPEFLVALVFAGPIVIIGIVDMCQTRHSIRRNFPVIAHFRYILEAIRPEINQYFIESNTDGRPFSREQRSVVYQRAKRQLDTLAFGTKSDVYEIGYEWLTHSLAPKHVDHDSLRVTVGGPQCPKPYSASIFNISAMSFGSLSQNAILALNGGAKLGNFYHDTGEGGLSPYHLQPGGDLVWEIGTGYFSARTKDGKFDPVRFTENSSHPSVKMVELKLSQGAKPGHGGILPARKLTREIADIRGVEMGRDVLSPPAHSAFKSPIGLIEFIAQMRELSGGKPAGFKLCIGKRREFLSICKAMVQTGIYPDFIVIDGGEGGTGAAPLEFSNHVGSPLRESQIFVHNALVGFGLRKHIKLIVSGRIITGFDIVSRIATGADICNSARGMMMALGCIQALRCNSNECPTGVATQDPQLTAGLVPSDKRQRVCNYHHETLKSVSELVGALGITGTSELRPWHLMKRTGLAEIKHYGEIHDFIPEGSLLTKDLPKSFARAMAAANADSFDSRG